MKRPIVTSVTVALWIGSFFLSLFLPVRYAGYFLQIFPAQIYPLGVFVLILAALLTLFLYKPVPALKRNVKGLLVYIFILSSLFLVIPFGLKDRLNQCTSAGGDHLAAYRMSSFNGFRCVDLKGHTVYPPGWLN